MLPPLEICRELQSKSAHLKEDPMGPWWPNLQLSIDSVLGLRGPATILWISRDACSDNHKTLSCLFLGGIVQLSCNVKWGVAQIRLCKTKYQGGVSTPFCGIADLPEKLSRNMGYRSDGIAISREMVPLSLRFATWFRNVFFRQFHFKPMFNLTRSNKVRNPVFKSAIVTLQDCEQLNRLSQWILQRFGDATLYIRNTVLWNRQYWCRKTKKQ